ncbi:hypothetical protein [Puia dinghuensis]|uniref:Uncharacterized protein n=1 Tax=Puia dinghuensis TaxID=1792502 RepID=A0A8J2XPY0_9BACT|nr:hypothetical protein [Puia dinghuensis]GGA82401.1 hypothetical protein GCM10011511_01710 [Puia dinghuensis]
MKTGVYSELFAVVSSLAIVLCFVPILFLGFRKMRQVNAYWVIGIYWFFNGLINLPTMGFVHSAGGRGFLQRADYCFTVAETPLVLLAFAFANHGRLRKQLLLVMGAFFVGELALLLIRGYNITTCSVITGVGLFLVLGYCIAGLWLYLKKMEHDRFEQSMVFVYAALLFGYGSCLIIYIFSHFHRAEGSYNETDSFLLYYISLLLSASVTSTGLGSYGLRKKRVRRSVVRDYSSSSS